MNGYGYVKYINKKLLTTNVYKTDVKGRYMNQALLELGVWSYKDMLCRVAGAQVLVLYLLFFFRLLAAEKVQYLLVEILP